MSDQVADRIPPILLRYQYPNSWKLWIYKLTWQDGLCLYDQFKDLEMQRLYCISSRAQYNHKKEIGKSEEMWWWKQRSVMWPWAKECRQLLEAREVKEQILPPLEPPQGTQLCRHLDFSPIRPLLPFWTSDVQKCKEINLCCFKPLSLWWFVIAAMRN